MRAEAALRGRDGGCPRGSGLRAPSSCGGFFFVGGPSGPMLFSQIAAI
ncbi:DUF6053 domain-containing protein [Lysobacter enzymogenes]